MSATVEQLTIAGDAVPYAEASATRAALPLTDAQREILRFVDRMGTIRPVQAGTIQHASRLYGRCGRPTKGIGCCEYAASDGSDAIKRLRQRGLLVPICDGLYGRPVLRP